MEELYIKDFDYPLPDVHIAEFPLTERDESRLLIYRNGTIQDARFRDLPEALPTGATIIFNDTRVIPARILFQKSTGAQIELFCLSPALPAELYQALQSVGKVEWHCLIGGASKWNPGLVLEKKLLINGREVLLKAAYLGKEESSFRIRFEWESADIFSQVLSAAGQIPLPPYIKRKPESTDSTRYQTIFAQDEGSVAAPTAALHFTPAIMEALAKRNIRDARLTLHVGAGTFKPVKSETISEHDMHSEPFSVSRETLEQLAAAGTLIAVGTTSLRSLESLYWFGVKLMQGNKELVLDQWEAYELADPGISFRESLQHLISHLDETGSKQLDCRTSLLIRPGYRIRTADALVTNFHQPRSTLLLLVAAFIGEDWKRIYAHALERGYRFLSYGDSSLLWRNAR